LIAYLSSRAIPGVETVEGDCYRRTMNTCGYPGVVDVRDAGDGAHLEATMHLATFGSIIEQVERVRAMFGLNHDSTAAERHLKRDGLLGPLVRRRPGLRLPGAFDRFETSVRIIIGQQVSVAGASTVTGRLVQRFGKPVETPLPGGLRFLFPSAATLAGVGAHDLSMPRARARTIASFAAAVAEGELDLSRVEPLDDTLARLEALPGVGPWTSNLIAARVMGHPDAFPASDLGIRAAASRLLGRTESIPAAEIEELAESWRPYRATAAAYLWMSAEQKER
jgi:AraC family transcriptional regulator of adaptative response / DNA-3-methyladenine glycosylase II